MRITNGHFVSYWIISLVWIGLAEAAAPTFENRTPVGFSSQDSTTQEDFVVGNEVTVRVDLNQAVTHEFPLIGHFHSLERSEQLSTTDTDGLQIDIAMVDVAPFGTNANLPAEGVTQAASFEAVIHMAWIEDSPETIGPVFTGGTTTAYEVMYSRSFDGGASFETPVSVSSGLSYYLMTASGTAFSTLDLEVESGGSPHVTYAFVSTADHTLKRSVYYTHSTDGGANWASPITVNDQSPPAGTTESLYSAFPRMAIDDRDNIFITYVRGTSRGNGADDIMLAKVNRSDFSMVTIGSLGTPGSSGGVRITPDAKRHTGPDIAVGDGNALHLVYFNDDDDRVEHRRLATDTTWVNVSTSGWSQDADGSVVGAFVDEVAANTALEQEADFFFPTVVVDRQHLPDRVYSLYKFGSAGDEGIRFNQYDDDGTTGTGVNWGSVSSAWSTGTTPLFDDGPNAYPIELDWTIAERVSAVVDDRLEERGDLHIAFATGYSGGSSEHDVYYARYNGTSWTLPEKVADDDSDGAGTEDGIATTDVFLSSPALAVHEDFYNLFMVFAGGIDEGFGVKGVIDVDQHPYLKVLGRDITSEDESVPVGGYQYELSYTPTNPQTVAATIADNPIYVHAADPTTATGLGASDASTDGFLTGNWETVGSTLGDDDKFFEGLIDEDPSSTKEWGDDDDKIGLLLKLNVLGSDSATNLQVVTNSTASEVGTGHGGRTVRVGSTPVANFAAGAFFALGADINIVVTSAAPSVALSEPDGVGDVGNTSFTIEYDLTDGDDDLDGNLKAALYAYPSGNLKSVQDIRIFGILIANENDVPANNADGTGDFEEGSNRDYTWDEPPDGLKTSALFASILRVPSASYYIYLTADDGKNPPVFAVSPGKLKILHSPVIQQIDPIAADTVDTGVRSGLKANPYDLDFSVVDYDSDARVQLFYAAASGITSVSATGAFPSQSFVLGKSVLSTRGTAITSSTSLSDQDREFSWDVTSPLVADGSYFLYAVATDSTTVVVDNSSVALVVQHSPSFTFFEPAKDTQRQIDSGSQSVFTIQWQKGPGDEDLDHTATADSVEVNTTSAGDLTILDVPAGRYVLAVKDTSHLSGRTDTIVIRNGESLILTSDEGFFASDIRGDPSFLLELDGRELKAGDVTEDNEVDEDDINAIDAAWGSNPVVLNFARADLNNDQRVGVEDLAAAISNISNITGFGAPPVFKEVTSLQTDVSAFDTNQSGLIVTPADGFDGEWVIGQVVPIVFAGTSLEDMAAYALDLTFDPAQMEIVGSGETIEIGRVFSPNPAGYFSRFDKEEGRLSVAAARRGKRWSANGQGDLLKLHVRLYEDGFPTSLQLEANMLSSSYHPLQLKVLNDPAALALPKDFSLEQNYPNPFNPTTTIPFRIPAVDIASGSRGSVIVSVDVYNALGQKVRTLVNESRAPGYYREVWDGRNAGGQGVGTGMYFYRLRVGDFEDVQRMTLIK